jgi:hypothetical protein
MRLAIGDHILGAIFIVVKPVPNLFLPLHDDALIWVERDTARIHQGTGVVKVLLCRLGIAPPPAVERFAFLPINDDLLSWREFFLPLLGAWEFVTHSAKMVPRLETVIVSADDQILDFNFDHAKRIFLLKVEMPDGIRLAENERRKFFLFRQCRLHIWRFRPFFYRFRILHCLPIRRTSVFQSSVQQERN